MRSPPRRFSPVRAYNSPPTVSQAIRRSPVRASPVRISPAKRGSPERQAYSSAVPGYKPSVLKFSS